MAGASEAVASEAVRVESGPAAVPGGSRRGAGLERLRGTSLAGLVRRATEQRVDEPGPLRALPVLPELRELLPWRGLRRGATLAVGAGADRGEPTTDPGTTSILLALLVAASEAGSWCAVVGIPTLGHVAASELGIVLDRLALVPNPGPDWPSVVAALLDGVDVVVAAPPGPLAPAITGRLMARARQRGSVLVSYGAWQGADLTLDSRHGAWQGLGSGRGRLRCRRLTIVARGRRAVAPKRVEVWLPAASGRLAPITDVAMTSAVRAGPRSLGRPALTVLSGSVPVAGSPPPLSHPAQRG